MKTIGFLPSCSAVWLISRTTWCALSGVSMNGRRRWRGLIANCERIELPKVSAVMPVPSETKKTVWRADGGTEREASGVHRASADDRQRALPSQRAALRIGARFRPSRHARARLSPPPPRRRSHGARRAAAPAICRPRDAPTRARVGRRRFFTTLEPSHVIHPPGDRLRRPVRHPENDRRRGGRRQERLPRRDDQPVERVGRSRARRLRDHGARVSTCSSPKAAWRAASPSGSPRSTSTTCARSPRPAPRSAAGSRRSRCRRRSRPRCGANSSG